MSSENEEAEEDYPSEEAEREYPSREGFNSEFNRLRDRLAEHPEDMQAARELSILLAPAAARTKKVTIEIMVDSSQVKLIRDTGVDIFKGLTESPFLIMGIDNTAVLHTYVAPREDILDRKPAIIGVVMKDQTYEFPMTAIKSVELI